MNKYSQPSIVVFAGPNGSGKSTITSMIPPIGTYVNADDIQRVNSCDALTAARLAEAKRNAVINSGEDLTFETVLSTDRNLKLLQRAKSLNYFVRTYYVLTRDPDVNITRVKQRVAIGGHDVPEEKIRARYARCIDLIPKVMALSDIFNIYDNTTVFTRIFSKKQETCRAWPNELWTLQDICNLLQLDESVYSTKTNQFLK